MNYFPLLRIDIMSEQLFLPTYNNCIICGQQENNPASLGIKFKITDDGVEARHFLDKRQEGYKNICHGGIQSALLDETIGWAVAVERKKFFMTMELNVRFIRSLPIGIEIIVKGRALQHKSRMSTAEGEIVDKEGTVYAKATGKFYLMDDEQATRVNNYLTFEKDDINILADDV